MSPDISVVIPAYNAEKTLAQAIASVLTQTWRSLEVIVVDDGSTDATATVAGNTSDDRVKVCSFPNGGVARARNRGLHEARGSFVAFLDADDVWRSTKLERQLALMHARPEIGMCFTAALQVDADLHTMGRLPALHYHDYCEALLLKSVMTSGPRPFGVVCSSGVIRRALADAVGGFDPKFSQCADWDFWLRLSRVTSFAPIADSLVLYRASAGNMSSDASLLERDTFAVLDKFFSTPETQKYLPLRSRAYSNHWMICSGSYLHAGQIGASLRCLARGIRAYPANIRRPVGLPHRRLARRRSVSEFPA